MLYIIMLLVFFCTLLLGLSFSKNKKSEKINVRQRLGQTATEENDAARAANEVEGSFAARVIVPIFRKLFEMVAALLPGDVSAAREAKLRQAGLSGQATSGVFFAAKLLLGMALGMLASLYMSASLLLVILFFFLGWSLPELYLMSRRSRREEEIERTLPDTLDLLTVSVEAGLGFDGAVLKVAEKSKGILATEFQRLLKENKMGKNRRDSLRDMAARLGNESITSFAGAIIQAEQLGISFANVLRLQAEQVRRKRRQRIEEAAMKAPVKMLIPLVLFIFPTIFIVLLGPAALRLIALFQGGL